MPKTRRRLDLKNEAGEVARLFSLEKEVWKKERLQVIKLLLETSQTEVEVAKIVGRSRSIVQKWSKLFREGGIQALLIRGNGGGRKSRLSESVKGEMIQKLKSGSFRTAKQFQKWLHDEHQINLSEKCIYYHLGKLGGCLKVPRPSHTKKDEVKVQEFRTTLAEKLTDLKLPSDREVKLWVYDEMRYGLHPLLRKMWSIKGHRVVAPMNRRYDWGYLFGAIEVGGPGSEFLYTDGINKEFDRNFLKQIAESDLNCEHVVIGDGAGFHNKEGQDNLKELGSNIHIITLPPYSPELNPIEKLWDIVKDSVCNKLWQNLAELEESITATLRDWWEKPNGFGSLFTNSYLRTELNAIWIPR